jgi:hypothetical protein
VCVCVSIRSGAGASLDGAGGNVKVSASPGGSVVLRADSSGADEHSGVISVDSKHVGISGGTHGDVQISASGSGAVKLCPEGHPWLLVGPRTSLVP